jgi:hypothetical protein
MPDCWHPSDSTTICLPGPRQAPQRGVSPAHSPPPHRPQTESQRPACEAARPQMQGVVVVVVASSEASPKHDASMAKAAICVRVRVRAWEQEQAGWVMGVVTVPRMLLGRIFIHPWILRLSARSCKRLGLLRVRTG